MTASDRRLLIDNLIRGFGIKADHSFFRSYRCFVKQPGSSIDRQKLGLIWRHILNVHRRTNSWNLGLRHAVRNGLIEKVHLRLDVTAEHDCDEPNSDNHQFFNQCLHYFIFYFKNQRFHPESKLSEGLNSYLYIIAQYLYNCKYMHPMHPKRAQQRLFGCINSTVCVFVC